MIHCHPNTLVSRSGQRPSAKPQSVACCSLSLSRNDAVEDGERGRLDRSRRRPADELAALALAHQMFGETPNRATGTVALPFSDCIVPAVAESQGEGELRG